MKPTLKTNFTSYSPVALISGPFFHHLDHLAPLCHFLDCPLLTDDSTTFSLGKKFYPEVDIRYVTINLRSLSDNYNLIILSTKHAKEELQRVYDALNIYHMRYCYCPHGQSDKGYYDKSMHSEEGQDIVLFYGKRQKNLIDPKGTYFIVGNFRLAYYEKFKKELDQSINTFLSPLPSQKTILYAPTWNDFETATTFFDSWRELIETLPDHYNLIIKLHPLLEKHYPADTYTALSYDRCKPNVRVLFEMPLIYPLLDRIDIYLGDYSAIGYDFLYFNRPLFFLGQKKVPLHACGKCIHSIDEFYQDLNNLQLELTEARTKEYHNAFSIFE